MTSGGKEFELLVRDIELLLQQHFGSGRVKSKWRHRVLGKESGQLREVDVALFIEAGYRTLFVAIECRNRKERQGVPWLEQLSTKRCDIGADRMVAVSSNGFTEPAIRFAKAKGIELYTLSNRETFRDGKKLLDVRLTIFRPDVSMLSLGWSYYAMAPIPLCDQMPKLSIDEASILTQNFEQPNWFDIIEGKAISLKEVISETLTWDILLKDVLVNGPVKVQRTNAELPKARYRLLSIKFAHGAFIVLAAIAGEFEVQWKPEVLLPDRVSQYRSTDSEPIIETHEYNGKHLNLDGQTIYFASVAGKNIQDSSTGSQIEL